MQSSTKQFQILLVFVLITFDSSSLLLSTTMSSRLSKYSILGRKYSYGNKTQRRTRTTTVYYVLYVNNYIYTHRKQLFIWNSVAYIFR